MSLVWGNAPEAYILCRLVTAVGASGEYDLGKGVAGAYWAGERVEREDADLDGSEMQLE